MDRQQVAQPVAERRVPALPWRRLVAPPFAGLVLAFVASAGIALVALGQYALNSAWIPFDWPYTSGLDARMHREFYNVGRPNPVMFALPMLIAGALLFAAAAPRAALPAVERWTAAARVEWRRALWIVAALVIPVIAWAWLNVRLYDGHYEPYYRWVFVLAVAAMLGGLAVLDRMRHRFSWPRLARTHALELLIVAALTGTFIGINCRDLASWRYASIGDDGEFYAYAQRLAGGLNANWFSQQGTYHYHPVLGSVWQALNLNVFGDGLTGWKMASLLAIALTIPPLYLLLRQLLGVRVAIFGTMFFAASHYLFSYAHTGYDSVFSLFPTVTSLALLLAGVRRRSHTLLFASGLFAGLGFYTFYSSRATIGLTVLFLLAMGPRRLRLQPFLSLGAGFAVAVLPIFATDGWDVYRAMRSQTANVGWSAAIEHYREDIARTFLGFNYNVAELHYTAGSLMDSVSGALAFAGFFLALTRSREFGYRAVVIWFVVAAAVTGVLSPYPDLAISRLHYAMPPAAALAGIAADRVATMLVWPLRRPRFEWPAAAAAFAVMAPLVFIVNGWHFFVYSAKHSPTSFDTVFIREVSASHCRRQNLRTVLYHTQPENILDPSWRFFGMEREKPLQLSLRYSTTTYIAYPATGGVGCVLLPQTELKEAEQPRAAMLQSALVFEDLRVVTDGSGARKVALSPSSAGRQVSVDVLQAAWRTDVTQGDGLDRVVKGQEKDFTPPLPPLYAAARDTRLSNGDPVIVVRDDAGAVRAYPERFLVWHGAVNDTFAGQPIVVTYDPIAATARVFRGAAGGRVLAFGNSGLLRDGNALLFDGETESWWQQLTGVAIAGPLAGTRLEPVQFVVMPFAQYARSYPDGDVLTIAAVPGTDESRINPYLGYDVPDGKAIFTAARGDDRLPAMRRVALVEFGGERVAVPFPEGATSNQVLSVDVGGRRLLLFFDATATSLLDTHEFDRSRAVGTFSAFIDPAPGLTFGGRPGDFVDTATSSHWNMLGEAFDGPDRGRRLQPAPLVEGFWSAISAAYPGIELAQ